MYCVPLLLTPALGYPQKAFETSFAIQQVFFPIFWAVYVSLITTA